MIHLSKLPVRDLFRLCKRERKTIILILAVSAAVCIGFALLRPVYYIAESSFREKSSRPFQPHSTTLEFFISGSVFPQGDHDGISVLRSQKILFPLIQKLSLQAIVETKKNKDSYLKRVRENLQISYGRAMGQISPMLDDHPSQVQVISLDYSGESPKKFQVLPSGKGSEFQLVASDGQVKLKGLFGKAIVCDGCTMTLDCAGSFDQACSITVLPLGFTIDALKNRIKVERDVKDKSLLKITFIDPSRQKAAAFLNHLMEEYQNYLSTQRAEQAEIQLAYLRQRQEEMADRLQDLMLAHASSLSQELNANGFADSSKEMEFLAQSQHQLKEKLIANKLEIKRLQNVQEGDCVYFDHYGSNLGDHQVINAILDEMRQAKQQRDALALSVNGRKADPQAARRLFLQQKEQLASLQSDLAEVNLCIESLNRGKPLPKGLTLFDDPRFLIKEWAEEVKKTGDQNQFLTYLQNLQHLILVHEKLMQERLVHQQNVPVHFSGITLKTAQELYVEYSKKLSELEASKRENGFLIEQMQSSDFEITSLSRVLTDPISSAMIEQSATLLLELKDHRNRSDREQQQLKEELLMKRTFLQRHVEQINALIDLNRELIEEKIEALQLMTLELLYQHTSVLENNLQDYLQSRISNLEQERIVIFDQMQELHQEMATLPKRWAAEKMIQQNLDINQLIVQEIAKMVESRNISHRLELIESAPMDRAIVPLQPRSAHLLVFAMIGLISGGLISSVVVIRKAISGELPASAASLADMGEKVIGTFEGAQASPDIVRKLLLHMQRENSPGAGWLILESSGPSYSECLSKQLIDQGLRPIRILVDSAGEGGLLPYLEGQIPFPSIAATSSGPVIFGADLFMDTPELLARTRFQELLKTLSLNYDRLLIVSKAPLASSLALYLTSRFDMIALSVTSETVNDLEEYIAYPSDQKRLFYFVKE